ncbi:lipoate--protein ligase [Aerococcus kribbianus]|uniref:lipoate--protein ligase n=1 Tax=Aerococcus kribbianus TaxID=2999064 RepID=A0A9X3JD39_9LACT|nr:MULTISPECIES: lipoate--protein ligase [unclassified Aerococcus]MCZ0717110.1 lipoate--protein ligase [Aerococcus sp. YH-aer221]MCZ0725398.1 lipoate--protein ligase [Aerococcus sp. YH-aer222]
MYLIEPIRDGQWVYDQGTSMAIQAYVRDTLFLDDDIIFPYMVNPSIQIGLNQNAYEEVNQPYMDAHNIGLVRRETGGGALYLDDRNMSYCFLFNNASQTDIYGNYGKLYQPIIKVLEKLGVDGLTQEGRNDLTLNGHKISGAAMSVVKGRVYAGFSLLLDPNYEVMEKALNPNQKKIASHGVQSVRARVGTLRDALAPEYQDITVEEFSDLILKELLEVDHLDQAKRYIFTPEDWQTIDQIAAERFNNWDWNYGRFRDFEYQVDQRFSGVGTLHVGLNIHKAYIQAIEIRGDFFGIEDVHKLEEALLGVALDKSAIAEALAPYNVNDYISNMDNEAFVAFILEIPDEGDDNNG